MGALLAQNITRKSDQPLVYASKLFNSVEHNYNTTKREALVRI
jgi:hypothetical protein